MSQTYSVPPRRQRQRRHPARAAGNRLSPDSEQRSRNSPSKKQSPTNDRTQHNGSFTVIRPTEERRQKLADMAKRGQKEYEKYKEEARARTNIVGSSNLLGGEKSIEQVRAGQASDNASAPTRNRLDRQLRIEEQKRQEQKRIDDHKSKQREIANRLDEANAARTVDADDLRSKRNQYLQQNQSNSTSSSSAARKQPQRNGRRQDTLSCSATAAMPDEIRAKRNAFLSQFQ